MERSVLRAARFLFALALLCGAAGAQQKAVVVTSCGTPLHTYANGAIEFLTQGTDGKLCVNNVAAAGAPANATYITQTANGTLSAEQAMGALATGLVKNTTTTGVQSIVVPAAGIETWLTTPSSANLLAALTDETGTGAAVFAAAPTFTSTVVATTSYGIGAAGVNGLWDSSFALRSDRHVRWASTANAASGTYDVVLRRDAAATFALGVEDAAAPVAQTIAVQDVVAGTSNTAGVATTFQGSRGTGTGAGGSFIFQTAPAGGSGSSQNALVTALTLSGTGAASFVSTVAATAVTTSAAGSSIVGVINGNDPAAGVIGEVMTGTVLTGAAVSLSTATTTDITSITLTAGDWDVSGMCDFLPAATTTVTRLQCSLSTVSGTINTNPGRWNSQVYAAGFVPNTDITQAISSTRFNVSGSTQVFLQQRPTFGTSTATGYGEIRARRMR